jgi:hypothetical protein
MKETSSSKRQPPQSPEMRAEYHLDYAKARPNRFAQAMQGTTVAVVLDPDVAAVFHTSEAVNAMLRSVLSALPEGLKRENKPR